MPTVFVSIGRKVTSPAGYVHDLGSYKWELFKSNTWTTLAHAGTIVGRFPKGVGEWDDEIEESAGWLVFLAHESDVRQLRPLLAAIGADYGQAAVGFVVHDDWQGESWIDCA